MQYNDLYLFRPDNCIWTSISSFGITPFPRSAMGFAAAPNGMLYVFGGYSFFYGEEGSKVRLERK
jgi:hypothetical protein